MGNIIGYVKFSCDRCKKYGLLSMSSLFYQYGSKLEETSCPFCQSEIEKSEPTALEISTFHKDIKAGVTKVLTLKDILIYHMPDEQK